MPAVTSFHLVAGVPSTATFVYDLSVGIPAVADISVVATVPVVALVPVVADVPASALLILFLHVQRENIQKCIKLSSYHTTTIGLIYSYIGLSDFGLAKNYQLLTSTFYSTRVFVYYEDRIIGKQ